MNKSSKIALMSIFVLILFGIIFFVLIIPLTKSDISQEDNWTLWMRTETQNIYKNTQTGEYQITIGQGILNYDDESKRYPNYVPFNQVVNMSFDLSSGNVTYSYKTKQREYSVTARMFFVVNVTQSVCNSQGWNWFDNYCYLWWSQARTFMQQQGIGYNVLITDNTYSYKYGLNFTSIPLTYQSKLLYVGMRLEDANGLTWDDINLDTENRRIIIKDKIALGYDDLLESGYTLNLYDKKTVLIGNVTNKSNLWLDPTITLGDDSGENLKDSTVREQFPNNNFGTDSTLYIVGDTSTYLRRFYLQFDISSFGSGDINISDSKLFLYKINTSISAYDDFGLNENISIHHVYNDWKNGTGSNILSETQLTWNNQPCGTGYGSYNLTNCNNTAESFRIIASNWTTSQMWHNFSIINMFKQDQKIRDNLSIMVTGYEYNIPSSSLTEFLSKEYTGTSTDPYLSITYTPYIDIISPTPAQIFTQDSATTLLNITTAINMTTCYYNNGSTNFTMSKLNNTYFFNSTAGTQYLDSSAHSVKFYCNQSDDGTWRTSDTINFEVDSVNITRCRDLNVGNRNYTLLNNVSYPDTCFNVENNTLSLNCNGYEINYSSNGGNNEYGVYSTYNFTTIKNCVIKEGLTGGNVDIAIYFYRARNGTIDNNTITTSGVTGHGIYSFFSSTNTLSNNTITTSGSGDGIVLVVSSGSNTVSSNTITTSGSGDGIVSISNSNSNTFSNNTITTSGSGNGIYLISDSNTFSNNTITTSGSGNGIYLLTGSNNNLFSGIDIKTNNTGNAFYIYDKNHNFTITDSILNSSKAGVQELYVNNTVTGGEWNFTNVTRANSSQPITVNWTAGANGTLTMRWYFQTQVNNSAGYLSGASVNIYDKDGTLKHSQLTGANGNITRQEVIEYVNNGGTKTFSTPHTVNVSKTGYITNSTVYNLTSQTNVMHYVTLTISNTAPTVTLSTPANNSWTNSLTNNLICNSTDADANLNNVTIYTWNATGTLQNSAPTTSITGSSNSTTFSSVGFINQGANKWNCYVCDSDNSCAWATSNFTLNTDTINPNINIVYPTNNTNTSNTQLNVNYTRSDTNLGSCWYTRNSGATNTTLANCINITGVTWNEGKNNITIYVNDSANNKNSSSITFTLDTIKPNINLVYPTATNYSINVSALNYTVSDATLSYCWYSINGGTTNNSVTCGTNLTGLTSTEGTNNWLVGVNDSVNNKNMSKVTFFKDTVYPLISYGTGTENTNTNFSRNWIYINTSWTELNFKNITFYLRNDTSIVNTTTYTTSTYFINFTNLVDNNYSYEVNITDRANNKNGTGIRRILIDDTPPTVNIVYPLEGGTYNFNNISINWTVSDNLIGLSSCWWTNNSGVTNNSITCNQNFTQNLSDGSYTYSIYSNDTLNNIGSQTRIFGISTTAPAIILNAPSDNQWFNNGTNIYFNFTATDSNGLSTCRLYANWTGSWAINYTWNSPNSGVMNWTTRNLTNGNYIWNVWCNDTNNNGAFSVSNRTVKIDTILPLISYGTGTAVDKANLSQSNIYVNVTFTEINFANISFSLYNDSSNIYTNIFSVETYEVNWTSLSNGNYSYYANITDSANNKNSTGIRYITLDTTNPNASLIYPSNNTFNSSTSYNFTANLSDNWGIKNATLYVYNETGEENRTTKTFGEYVTTYTLGIVVTVVEGIKNWWYDVWDWAGNFFQTGNYTLTVDTTYPSVILSGFTPATIYNDNDAVIFANITDTYLNTVWLRINFTGSYQNITITNKVGDTYNYTIVSTVIENFENISWYWYANDSSNNVNVSSLSSFLVSNRNPYNVNITSPINGTFKNTNWIWVNFTGSDDDGDTLNYSLYNSTNGINFSFFSSTTGSSLNFSNYNFTEGVIHYLYVTANDTKLQNISSNISFTIDNTNPVINTISYPLASPTYQCSMTNIALNYSVSDTNLDYCNLNVTFSGLISTAHTIISDCSNTTFNVSYDNSVQELNFYVYDEAGNIDSETRLIYIDTDNAGCPQPSPSPSGGGGTPTYITPPSNKTFCGDGICQSVQKGFLLGNDAGLKEDFWNCFQDCGQNVTLPNFLCNPFKNITEIGGEQCVWSSSSPFRVIFFITAGILVFVILFKIEKPGAKYQIKFTPYSWYKKRKKKRRYFI